jgi:hypothetical protein
VARNGKRGGAFTVKQAEKIDPQSAVVHLSMHTHFFAREGGWEPDDYLCDIAGHIEYIHDDESKGERKIGEIEGHFINVDAVHRAGERLFDVFDARSQEAHEYFSAIFDVHGNWTDVVLNAVDMLPSNLLVLHLMRIRTAYRGQGIGLAVMKAILHAAFIPSNTFVLILPYATGHEHGSKAYLEGTRKLRAYWRRAGFKRLRGTEHYFTYIP